MTDKEVYVIVSKYHDMELFIGTLNNFNTAEGSIFLHSVRVIPSKLSEEPFEVPDFVNPFEVVHFYNVAFFAIADSMIAREYRRHVDGYAEKYYKGELIPSIVDHLVLQMRTVAEHKEGVGLSNVENEIKALMSSEGVPANMYAYVATEFMEAWKNEPKDEPGENKDE